MTKQLFVSMNSEFLATELRKATRLVCYAAPGIHPEPAKALADLAITIKPENITVHLDFDESVLRMGFGTLDAIKLVRCAGIDVRSSPGLRVGLVIIDDGGYVFTPTALFLEAEAHPDRAPNSMRLMADQVSDVLARFSPETNAVAQKFAQTEVERERISGQTGQVPSDKVADTQFTAIKKQLDAVPTVEFDLARRVHVYTARLQYVELKLTGVAIQRYRIRIPQSILALGGDDDLARRLHTSVDLIEKSGELSSEKIDCKLNKIRTDFTRLLGGGHGRVLLKAQKAEFLEQIEQLEAELEKYKTEVEDELKNVLEASRKQIIGYYLQKVIDNPPDCLHGKKFTLVDHKLTKADAECWLKRVLAREFPEAGKLIKKMELDVKYKDMTIETLEQEGFFDAVKKAYPKVNWDKPYDDYITPGIKE